jgi:hypothetical protein
MGVRFPPVGPIHEELTMNQIVLHLDDIRTSHDENVFKAFEMSSAPRTIFGAINLSFGFSSNPNVLNHQETSEVFLGLASVINWSFSELFYTDRYLYSDDVIKQGFLKNTAFTVSAGNNAGCGSPGEFAFFVTRPQDSIPKGYYQKPAFERIDTTASSPYDFTVGSIQTFRWNFTDKDFNDPQARAIKDAVFDIACFSEVAPRFVDFYTYGDAGTSFAAPFVAGLITRIRSDNPDYDLNQIRTVLERNSKLMQFERYPSYEPPYGEKIKLIVQVLDPYDLENNKIRDGRMGESINLFTDGITREDYTFTFDTTHRIDIHTKVDGIYEILFGRNPDQAGLNWWLENIKLNGWSVSEVINRFCDSEESNWFNSESAERTSMVPLIERVQALHHVGLSREPSLEETVRAIEYYNDNGENWSKFVADFIGYHKIETENLVW